MEVVLVPFIVEWQTQQSFGQSVEGRVVTPTLTPPPRWRSQHLQRHRGRSQERRAREGVGDEPGKRSTGSRITKGLECLVRSLK